MISVAEENEPSDWLTFGRVVGFERRRNETNILADIHGSWSIRNLPRVL